MDDIDFLGQAVKHLMEITLRQIFRQIIPVVVEVEEPEQLPPKKVEVEVKFLENNN